MFPFPPHPGIYIWQDDKSKLAAAVYLVVHQSIYIITKKKEFLEPRTAFPYRV